MRDCAIYRQRIAAIVRVLKEDNRRVIAAVPAPAIAAAAVTRSVIVTPVVPARAIAPAAAIMSPAGDGPDGADIIIEPQLTQLPFRIGQDFTASTKVRIDAHFPAAALNADGGGGIIEAVLAEMRDGARYAD